MSEPSVVLDYGRERRPRWWRRVVRWTLAAALLAVVASAGVYGFRRASIWFERRAGYRTVVAWYEQARATTQPAGTLLYSDDPADFRTIPPFVRIGKVFVNNNGVPLPFDAFATRFPTLRSVRYRGEGGVPILVDDDVLYAHEHSMWTTPSGSAPAVVCVQYRGLDHREMNKIGRPQFSVASYRVNPISDPLWFPSTGAWTAIKDTPGRSMARLRIFAGVPHPTDRCRFSLPFSCDGGRGRFEFRTDDDASDGGKLAPDVWIEWDDAATRPTTEPADDR